MVFKKLRRSRTAMVGVCCALVGAAVVPVISLAGSISGSTGDGPMVLQSGETAATYEGKINVGSLGDPGFKQLWHRVGDTVTVSGAFPVTPASAGSVQVYIPLPIDSNVAKTDCVGNASINSLTAVAGRILGSDIPGHTHRCFVEWPAPQGGVEQWLHYTMTYRVRD